MSDIQTATEQAKAAIGQLEALEKDAQAVISLPSRNDASSWESKIQSLVMLVVGIVALLHPGFKEPSVVAASVVPASLLVAGIIQAVDVWRRRSGRNAAVASGQVKIVP